MIVTVSSLDRLPCVVAGPLAFFAEDPEVIEFAKQLCAECPVREACLAAALERAEACGVWGGELIVNGAVVARKRGRGRPPKTAVVVRARAPEDGDREVAA
ncbi:WhiB family transcriptional regulator [Granulicoccus phenolivorans]|uniref:WhiB family transcriptional regulator n=1 Tax=Granulicoccus phenolivorans TaxID=266854 RepID=UPI00041D85B0|nr:WhiB family transcriptional regulator [Granulicoccus phenolivorans]